MRIRFRHRSSRSVAVLFLVLSILGLVVAPQTPQAHATGIIFKNLCDVSQGSGTTANCTITGVTSGDSVIVSIFGIGVFNGFIVSDGASDTYLEFVFSLTGSGGGVSSYIFATSSVASSGSLVVTVATGGPTRTYGFVASEYSGITGFGKTGTDQQDSAGNSGSSTIALTGTGAGSALADDIGITGTGAPGFTITANNGQVVRVSGSGGSVPCPSTDNCKSADTTANTSPTAGWSWSGGVNCAGACSMSHSVLELQSTPSTPTPTVTQCYGNCGSPPITLANTNSTHTINFNQSITLLYEFQSNINGFVQNYTLNYAAICGSGNKCTFQVLYTALYTIPLCPLGTTPFSVNCPGLRVSAASTSPPTKQRFSAVASNVPVFAGQWVGVAVSARFSGADINDTNTSVALFQTNEGVTPLIIQAAVPASPATSKMGLWAWISGNAVTNGPSINPSTACGPGFDLMLTCLVNAGCTVVTSACQTGSAMFLIIVLTIISIMTLLGIMSYWLPSMNLTTRGIGEFAVLIFIGWFVVFGAYGLILPWLLIFGFFVIAWLFLGKARGTGPI